MTLHRPTPAFRTIVSSASDGTVLKPLLHAYLFDARWPQDMTLVLPKRTGPREPDGWFHPSTHPLWPERMLYYYLTAPERMIHAPFEYMGTMSVTFGTLMHLFIQECLRDQGVLLDAAQLEAEGIAHDDKGEPAYADETVLSRGNTDGVLRLHLPRFPDATLSSFEFKTSFDTPLRMIQDLDTEAFKAKWPTYWAQQQEYLRLSGFRVAVVLMLGLGTPWTIREFHLEADLRWQTSIAAKYRRVRDAVAVHQEPLPCCAPWSAQAKACPMRAACPIGVM